METKADNFVRAISEFGIDAAMEYFNTPAVERNELKAEIEKQINERNYEQAVGKKRDDYLKSLSELNEFDRLVTNLVEGEFTISHLELAYREYIRRRKDLPEGAKNLLVCSNGAGQLQFASRIKEMIGNIHLAYMRGRQEGHDVKDPNKWEGIVKRG